MNRLLLLVLCCVMALATVAGCSLGGADPAALLAAAQRHQGKGEHSAAIIELRNLLALEPDNVEARLLLASSYGANGQHAAAEDVRQHLLADLSYQQGMVRFIENHDEPRAATAFPDAKGRAAAVVVMTLPGARLLHEGQVEGATVRLPVFLGRRPIEDVDLQRVAFYERLFEATRGPLFRDGDWRLCDRSGWPDNQSCRQLLAWSWARGDARALVVINYADAPAQGRVHLPWEDLPGRGCRLVDRLSGETYERQGSELGGLGLYVALGAWQAYLFSMEAGMPAAH